ncbi:MAG TPA: hypothetical protein VFE05_11500, partial [Longimicrobiaceae bacterium]|nr:hypothetical protein [Longimicrobiaceae bacterium]
GVLFAADAFFGAEPLAKHGVPYLVDAGRARATLLHLQSARARWMVPGHGDALDDPAPTLDANLEVIDRAFAWLRGHLALAPAQTEDVLAEFAAAFGLQMGNAGSYVLNRTALLSFLSTLEREGAASVLLEGGRWLWTGTD